MSADDRDVEARVAAADRRMADADALLEIASAQLSVAARNIADATAAEREYRRATWHYVQLMRERLDAPLETIIGMAETLADVPDLDSSRRTALAQAIVQQAEQVRRACRQVDEHVPREQRSVERRFVPRGASGDDVAAR
jgi:exopolyphosphatase/pppGpp-phosphohydrolase